MEDGMYEVKFKREESNEKETAYLPGSATVEWFEENINGIVVSVKYRDDIKMP